MKEKTLSMKTVIVGILSSLLAVMVASLGSQLVGSVLIIFKLPQWLGYMAFGISYIVFTVCFLRIIGKKVLNRSLVECRIRKVKIHKMWIVSGFVLPISIIMIFLCMPGEWEIQIGTINQTFTLICVALFYYTIGAAVVEEMVFRGVIMHILEEKFNVQIAMIVPSVLFGLVHATAGMGALDMMLLFIAGTAVGMMFSLIAYENNSIWASVLVHGLWNFMIVGDIFRIGAVSETEAIISYKIQTQNLLFTGGEFGIEASIIATIAYFIIGMMALIRIRNKVSKSSSSIN